VTLARRIDLWLPPLAVMALIFVLSAQPDLSSGLGLIDVIGRKLIHAAEYALLCALWWRFLREAMPGKRAALVALGASVAYAVTDEYHQSFVEGRNGTVIDVAIDAGGAALAAIAVTRTRARTRV
jgi:VanZ family protein